MVFSFKAKEHLGDGSLDIIGVIFGSDIKVGDPYECSSKELGLCKEEDYRWFHLLDLFWYVNECWILGHDTSMGYIALTDITRTSNVLYCV